MIATRGSLDQLIASLAAIDVFAAPPSTLEGILRTANIDDAGFTPFLNFVPERYTRQCVYRDERFELLVLCWAAGARSAIHDHGGSRCIVKIVRGSLRVDNYAIVAGGRAPGQARLAPIQRDTLRVGDIDARNPARDVHQVAAHAGDAISLHIYAKPLDRCLVFDVARQSCSVAVNRYDTWPSTVVPR